MMSMKYVLQRRRQTDVELALQTRATGGKLEHHLRVNKMIGDKWAKFELTTDGKVGAAGKLLTLHVTRRCLSGHVTLFVCEWCRTYFNGLPPSESNQS